MSVEDERKRHTTVNYSNEIQEKIGAVYNVSRTLKELVKELSNKLKNDIEIEVEKELQEQVGRFGAKGREELEKEIKEITTMRRENIKNFVLKAEAIIEICENVSILDKIKDKIKVIDNRDPLKDSINIVTKQLIDLDKWCTEKSKEAIRQKRDNILKKIIHRISTTVKGAGRRKDGFEDWKAWDKAKKEQKVSATVLQEISYIRKGLKDSHEKLGIGKDKSNNKFVKIKKVFGRS